MEADRSGKSSIDVVLAEFNALRAEKVSHITGQAAVVGLGLTALGVIAGFVAKEGHDRLLLAIPPIAMLVALGYAAGSYRSTIIGEYIRDQLWPHLEANLGDYVGVLPSWQHHISDTREKWGAIPKVIFLDFPPTALFIAASGYALYAVDDHELLWLAGVAMTATSLLVPLVVALKIKGHSKKAAPRRGQEPRESTAPN